MRNLTAALLVLLSSILVACGEDSSKSENGALAAPKATLSGDWAVNNHAWGIDLSNGNFSGTPFSGIYTFSDLTTCTCTWTMTGNESSGTYTASSCSSGGSGMTDSVCPTLTSGSTPTYSSDGTVLSICRNTGSCIQYY